MIKLGIVMDPISSINIKKDTSFGMLLEAQSRGYELHYMEMDSLYLRGGEGRALTRKLSVKQDYDSWYEFGSEQDIALQDLDVILKPLDGMGGASIFRLKPEDANVSVIIETLTEHGSRFCMAQNYLPAIKDGDKRVLVVDGEPVPYCLARIPAQGETRGNLAAGGRGEARPLSESDWAIARKVAPILKEKGLIFVGLDIIGDRLTEINVTSPTCAREIEAAFPISVTGMLMDAIEKRLANR